MASNVGDFSFSDLFTMPSLDIQKRIKTEDHQSDCAAVDQKVISCVHPTLEEQSGRKVLPAAKNPSALPQIPVYVPPYMAKKREEIETVSKLSSDDVSKTGHVLNAEMSDEEDAIPESSTLEDTLYDEGRLWAFDFEMDPS